MRTIVICEKPSQAKNIQAAIGNRHGQVFAAAGHLLTLSPPDRVRPEWKKWSTELLDPGGPWPKEAIQEDYTRRALARIHEALKTAERVIIATDCDREGTVIGMEILEAAGYGGEVKRALFAAEDKDTLAKAFDDLRPVEETAGMYAAGRAREQADIVCNLTLTRAASVHLVARGREGVVGIGRVKTPVLAIVCRREREILDFVPDHFHEIVAPTIAEGSALELVCGRPPGIPAPKPGVAVDTQAVRIMDRSHAERIAAAAEGWSGALEVGVARKKQGPPRPYDLATLQQRMGRKRWPAKKTLEVAQELYEKHKVITYPRAESRVLPAVMADEVPGLVARLLQRREFSGYADVLSAPVIRSSGKGAVFSDRALAGSAHHAIIPNPAVDVGQAVLAGDALTVFEEIAAGFLASVAPDCVYDRITVRARVPVPGENDPAEFEAAGRRVITRGFTAILKASQEEDEPEIGLIADGSAGAMADVRVEAKETKPPPRYGEGTLIKAMKEAWRFVDDPEYRERLKESAGIGTAATRDSIIDGLVSQGQLVRDKGRFKPGEDGWKLWKLLERVCPELVDPARTAIWELLFDGLQASAKSVAPEVWLPVVDALAREAATAAGKICAISTEGIEFGRVQTARPAPGGKGGGRRGKGKSRSRSFTLSEKQAALARSLVERGVGDPPEDMNDAHAVKAYIDACMAGGGPPPSAKQVAFANRLAGSGKVPKEAMASARTLSAWIDEKKATRRSGG